MINTGFGTAWKMEACKVRKLVAEAGRTLKFLLKAGEKWTCIIN